MIPRHLVIGLSVMVLAVAVMGVYVWQMSSRIAEVQATATDTRPVAPPAAGPTEQVTLFVADDEAGVLHARTARIPLPGGRQQRAEELLRALLDLYLDKSSPHHLAAGAEVRNVYLVEPGLAVIDFNAEFADGHRSGILLEQLTVASFLQSLSANVPGISRIRILVDGKSRETLAGHVDLGDFYDVSAITKMAAQMQPGQ
ncbi:MAG TPA: GerMN domain-containing protein [Terriglobales bacterium]|nr:GerMN domain-containing protein [Terriglobales bacterium]